MTTFEKLSPPRFLKRSSFVAEQIIGKIRSGEFLPGSKLPPERMLAEQMGVGRPTIREAISALQIAGILESRPGDGNYVQLLNDTEKPAKAAFDVLETSESPLQILQARKALEIGVAQLAITEASDEDLRRIQTALEEKIARGRGGQYSEYLRYGKKFHLAIAQATKNPVIVRLMENLLEASQQPLSLNMRKRFYEQDEKRIDQMLRNHQQIVQALVERDLPRMIALMEEHFDLLIQQLYNEKTDGP
ncbi:MAG: FadR/GntR family transcriptional regulator [Desulfobacterales bacterium]